MKTKKDKKIKYIHIMSHGSIIFNPQIIKMINNNPNYFDSRNHLFIISNLDVFNLVKEYDNVIYNQNISKSRKTFIEYANLCDFIFLHCNTLKYMPLFLNKKILNKIIWVEWGNDLYIKKIEKKSAIKQKIVRILKNFVKSIINKRIKKFYAVGIGPKYDAIEVKCNYGKDMRILMTPYGYSKGNKEKVEKIANEMRKETKKNSPIKVMIGHSAYPFLKHIEYLNILSKFKHEKILISLVLVYGDQEYAQKVKKEAYKLFDNDKIEIIDKRMSLEEYERYLSTVDICILDYKHQAAMSNFGKLLYFGKKLFINNEGYLNLICTLENIETYDVEMIEKMNFEEFSKPVMNPENGIRYIEQSLDEQNYISKWQKTIKELEKVEE